MGRGIPRCELFGGGSQHKLGGNLSEIEQLTARNDFCANRWAHNTQSSEAQALTTALRSAFRRSRIRSCVSASIGSADRRACATAIRTVRSGSPARRSNAADFGLSCMPGIHNAARRTDGFLCFASSVLWGAHEARFDRVRIEAPVACSTASSDRIQSTAISTTAVQSPLLTAARARSHPADVLTSIALPRDIRNLLSGCCVLAWYSSISDI